MSIKSKDELTDLFKRNQANKPRFDAAENWKQIQNRLNRKRRYVFISFAAAVLLALLAFPLITANSSDLFSDERFAEIIKLENLLEEELSAFSIDSTQLEADYRLQIVLDELEHVNERIEECKREIELNPFNPNYHKALFALYKSKRRIIEIIKERG